MVIRMKMMMMWWQCVSECMWSIEKAHKQKKQKRGGKRRWMREKHEDSTDTHAQKDENKGSE
jgi:hypothetical protein